MPQMKWNDKHIEITPPKRPKKITGTRFAAILGMNPWATPFETWCAITRTYEKPFEDTIYTKAGKIIEPKQAQYMRKSYAMYGLKTPEDVFGANPFGTTFGDFFHHVDRFGGMWDYLVYEDDELVQVLEMKTTKRAEDWGADVPEYYALQAALYAHLLRIDDVTMVVSFLEPKDYEHPEDFVPSVENTAVFPFKMSERYPDFEQKIEYANEWWEKHVVAGISPDYDEKKDAEILAALRTNYVDSDEDVNSLIAEAEGLKAQLEQVYATVSSKESRLKVVNDTLKKYATGQLRDGDKKVILKGSRYVWTLSRNQSQKFDEKLFAKDYPETHRQYLKPETTYRLTVGKLKEDE